MISIDLGRYDAALTGIEVAGIRLVQDSRAIQPGDIFVAVGSTGAPGIAFAADALARGAAAVLYDSSIADPAPIPPGAHGVAGLSAQLGGLAADLAGNPSEQLTLVGVTGTNGKTSIVQLLGQAWQMLGLPAASIGTLGAGMQGAPRANTGLTTPPVTRVHELLAEFRDAGALAVAIEVSSHALEQGRVAGALFDIVVFTNVTRDHLDYHGTMEAYAAVKERIFDLPGTRAAVINVDDPYGEGFYAARAGDEGVIGVSSRGHASALIRADDVRLTAGGIDFVLVVGESRHPVSSSLIGRFNVDNLLGTAGVLHSQGYSAERIAEVLGALEPVFGRMNRIQPDESLPLVVVDYAHTPDAISQSLSALAQYDHGRIVTVFGCTGDRDRGKRPDMARIVEAGSDLVVVTDDDVHHEDGDRILDDIRAGFERPNAVVELRDRAAAIEYAIGAAQAGDVVLIAGKGHEDYQVIGDEHVPFSDTEVAERVLRARLSAG